MIERAAPLSPIVVEELHDRAAISALAPAWERLRGQIARAGGVAGPFLAPGWFALQAVHLTGAPKRGQRGTPAQLRLLVAHHDGEPCAIVPLLAERRRLSGLPARVLRSLSDDHSQRFDALIAHAEAARALMAHLQHDRSWDVLELRDAPLDRPTGADQLSEAARALGLGTAQWASMRSPYLALPSSEEALDRQLGAKFRSNLRRRKRKLISEVGELRLERIADDTDRATLDRALTHGFALEAAGWKGAQGTAIACDPRLCARYAQLARVYQREGKLALYFLTVGGVRKAFHFALIEDGVYYLFKPGYDPALASYGLGHLLVDAVARDLIARGVRELDFLGDEMPWKREWTGESRAHAWRYVFSDGARGRALHAWKFGLAPRLRPLLARLRRRPAARADEQQLSDHEQR
jgi:CelD/BcsL family acetyltransferase involved in cellulose biosynthesis